MVMPASTVTWPSSGCSWPAIIRKIVVLPAPFGPTSPTFSPFWIAHRRVDEQDLMAVLLADVVETNHGGALVSGDVWKEGSGTQERMLFPLDCARRFAGHVIHDAFHAATSLMIRVATVPRTTRARLRAAADFCMHVIRTYVGGVGGPFGTS